MKIGLNSWVLREEFHDNGADNGGGNMDAVDDIYEEPTDDTTSDDTGATDDYEPAAPTPGSSQIDMEKLGKAIGDSLAPRLNPQQTRQEPQISPEEFRKQTGYFEVQPQHVEALFNAEVPMADRIKVLQQMLDGASGHGIKVANLMIQKYVGDTENKFTSALTPIQKEREEAARKGYVGSIVKVAPAFKGKEKFVNLAIDSIIKSGYESKGDKEDRIHLLRTATQLIRQLDPNFSPNATSNSANRAGNPKPGGAVNSGGSGGGGAKKQKVPDFEAIWKV